MQFGYARVSTREQDLTVQLEELQKAGCERVFSEKKSGVVDREEFNKMVEQLRDGDAVCVTEISRLGRKTADLIRLQDDLHKQGIHFVSIREGIDTRTEMGKLWYYICAIFAENERKYTKNRSDRAKDSARARGIKGGRPRGLSDEAKKKALMVQVLYKEGQPVESIRKALKIGSNATFYKYLEYAKQSPETPISKGIRALLDKK